MKAKLILFIVMIFTLISEVNAQKKLSLKDAITIALHQNTSLIKSTNNLETQRAAVKNAYGNLLPTLNLSGSWSWQRVSDKGGGLQIDYFGRETVIPPSQVDTRSYTVGLNGSVTIFDGLSNIATINQRENSLQAAKYDLQKQKQDIVMQTANLYYAIIGYEKLLKFEEENYKYNLSLLDKIKEMQELKSVPLSDVHSQEVQVANAELSLLQTKNSYEKAKVSLLNYLSLDITDQYSFELPDSTSEDTAIANADFSSLLNIALSNRKDYQSQKLLLDNAFNQLTIARSDYLPSLTGSYRFSTSSVQPSELFNRKIYNVGLSLNLPVFSHWATDLAVQTAKVQILNTTEDLNALERQIKSDVKNALLDLQTAKTQLEVSHTALKSAKESWEIKQENYTLGIATFVDLQQAYKDYLQAQSNDIQAQYNYFTKQFVFKNALGILDVE
ncbi:TolC family protein [Melioribacteraceae bacterium 4301-Me]|uniref:TolC family protein n=1 Tax=Pyranulibacter aquaticus TaxID=3163344 RepID=UPI00359B7849